MHKGFENWKENHVTFGYVLLVSSLFRLMLQNTGREHTL